MNSDTSAADLFLIFQLGTMLFVILKTVNYVDWSWWLVFSPTILYGCYLIIMISSRLLKK